MMLRFFGATIAMRCTHIAWTIYFTDQNRTHTCTPYKDVGAIRASLVLINIPKQPPYQVTALGCGNAAFCKHITKRLLIHIRTGTATEFVITRNYIKWSHGARIHMRFAQSLSHTHTHNVEIPNKLIWLRAFATSEQRRAIIGEDVILRQLRDLVIDIMLLYRLNVNGHR